MTVKLRSLAGDSRGRLSFERGHRKRRTRPLPTAIKKRYRAMEQAQFAIPCLKTAATLRVQGCQRQAAAYDRANVLSRKR
jgi:hypothetical protein